MSAIKEHHHDTIEAAQRPKQRPILFNTEMVRAILEGRKTQSRRIIKNIPPAAAKVWHDGAEWIIENERGECWLGKLKCPYGRPGDRLWVRETWAEICYNELGCDGLECLEHGFEYKADKPAEKWPGSWPNDFGGDEVPDAAKWHPSIHMPRHAARLFLEITDVRAERLQNITDADAYDEGFEWVGHGDISPQYQFRELWQKINGHDSWEQNPWVWVITFNRIKT